MLCVYILEVVRRSPFNFLFVCKELWRIFRWHIIWRMMPNLFIIFIQCIAQLWNGVILFRDRFTRELFFLHLDLFFLSVIHPINGRIVIRAYIAFAHNDGGADEKPKSCGAITFVGQLFGTNDLISHFMVEKCGVFSFLPNCHSCVNKNKASQVRDMCVCVCVCRESS